MKLSLRIKVGNGDDGDDDTDKDDSSNTVDDTLNTNDILNDQDIQPCCSGWSCKLRINCVTVNWS